MPHTISGYFRMPPNEVGADLIFVPHFVRELSALEIAEWARRNDYGALTYIPSKVVEEKEDYAAS